MPAKKEKQNKKEEENKKKRSTIWEEAEPGRTGKEVTINKKLSQQ